MLFGVGLIELIDALITRVVFGVKLTVADAAIVAYCLIGTGCLTARMLGSSYVSSATSVVDEVDIADRCGGASVLAARMVSVIKLTVADAAIVTYCLIGTGCFSARVLLESELCATASVVDLVSFATDRLVAELVARMARGIELTVRKCALIAYRECRTASLTARMCRGRFDRITAFVDNIVLRAVKAVLCIVGYFYFS